MASPTTSVWPYTAKFSLPKLSHKFRSCIANAKDTCLFTAPPLSLSEPSILSCKDGYTLPKCCHIKCTNDSSKGGLTCEFLLVVFFFSCRPRGESWWWRACCWHALKDLSFWQASASAKKVMLSWQRDRQRCREVEVESEEEDGVLETPRGSWDVH